MAMATGNLTLRPISAQLTHDTEIFGKMDPFCVVKIGMQEQRTRVHHDAGKFPQWSECFSFRIQMEDIVNFIIWEHDSASANDLIGEGSVSLASLKKPGRNSEYVSLLYKGKPAGKIYIETEWFPDKKDEPKQPQQQQPMQQQQPQVIVIPGAGGYPPAPQYPAPGYPPYQQPPAYPPQQPAYPPAYPQQAYPPAYPPQQYPPQQYPPQQYPQPGQGYQQPPPAYPPAGGNPYGPPPQMPQQQPYGQNPYGPPPQYRPY